VQVHFVGLCIHILDASIQVFSMYNICVYRDMYQIGVYRDLQWRSVHVPNAFTQNTCMDV